MTENTWRNLVQENRARSPDLKVLSFLKDASVVQSWTYADLDLRAKLIATKLLSHASPGDRVLLLHPPGLEFVASLMGCFYSGLVAVPTFPPRSPRHTRLQKRLANIATDAHPTLALTTAAQQESIAACLQPLAEDVRLLTTDLLDSTLADDWCQPGTDRRHVALLQYTAGTTGRPKGVPLTHGNLLHNSGLIQQRFEHTENSTGVSWLPPYHDMGLIGGILQPLFAGFPIYLMAPGEFLRRPATWLEAITRFHGTTSGGPNFAYDWCVQKITDEQLTQLDLSSWDLAFNGAESVRTDTIARFSQRFAAAGFRPESFLPCYGLAEATLIVSGSSKSKPPVQLTVDATKLAKGSAQACSPDNSKAKTLVSCGSFYSSEDVIVRTNSTEASNEGDVGEVWVGGESVFDGYWISPNDRDRSDFSATTETATVDGKTLFRTGDLGFLWNGELFITGRSKEQIIIRGVNYDPLEIELTAQHAHPALARQTGAAFVRETDNPHELFVVHEVDRSFLTQKVDLHEISTSIRTAISTQLELQVNRVVLVKPGQIPRTPSGKVQRRGCDKAIAHEQLDTLFVETEELANSASDQGLTPNEITPPNDTITRWLTETIATATEISPDNVDPSQPFAAYGLDSITAANIGLDIEERLDCRLPSSVFWDYPTIAELAQFLATIAAKSAVLESLDVDGE